MQGPAPNLNIYKKVQQFLLQGIFLLNGLLHLSKHTLGSDGTKSETNVEDNVRVHEILDIHA